MISIGILQHKNNTFVYEFWTLLSKMLDVMRTVYDLGSVPYITSDCSAYKTGCMWIGTYDIFYLLWEGEEIRLGMLGYG